MNLAASLRQHHLSRSCAGNVTWPPTTRCGHVTVEESRGPSQSSDSSESPGIITKGTRQHVHAAIWRRSLTLDTAAALGNPALDGL